MKEQTLRILAEACRALDERDIPPTEKDALINLIDNHALLAMLRQQAEELDALKKLSVNLTSSLDLPDVLDAIVSEAMQLIPNASGVNIFLYSNGKLSFGAALDSKGNRNAAWMTPRPNRLTYTVARTGETLIVENIREHPLFANAPSEWSGSIIGIPLKFGDEVVGVMNMARVNIGSFFPSELRLLDLLSDQAAIAISNANLHQIISRQAYSDTLTGLPNRRALDDRLKAEIQSARRHNYSFAVVMMDLDGFKDVNDSYGHAIGDDVLRLVFNQMARGVRNTDFLARYGGDELTLILAQSDISSARVVTEKILKRMRKIKFTLPNEKKLSLGVSGGIAIYPVHARSGPDLLRAADAALYQAKKHNRGTFQIARGVTAPISAYNLGGE